MQGIQEDVSYLFDLYKLNHKKGIEGRGCPSEQAWIADGTGVAQAAPDELCLLEDGAVFGVQKRSFCPVK